MPATHEAPADTTMTRIVHNALRRDLMRARTVLAAADSVLAAADSGLAAADSGLAAADSGLEEPGGASVEQRRAIGAHLIWLMHFLHAHHASEDEGYFPLMRQRVEDPADIAVLDRMGSDHEAITAP